MTGNVEGSCPECRAIRRQDLRVHELDGEALIFDPLSNDTHRLNETALFIWHHCDGQQDATSIANRLADQYDVTPQDALEHVQHALKDLEALGLILQAGGCEKPEGWRREA